MATNNNSVNISALPKSQVAANNDMLILQTQNGTQTIRFQDFNVVRTDAEGNATVLGNLSGNDSVFAESRINLLKFNALYTGGEFGTTGGPEYYNRFRITNGAVVSADYITGSPEYQTLFNLYQTLSANSSQNYKKIFEYVGTAFINTGSRVSNLIYVGGFPSTSFGASVGSLINSTNYASYFTITPVADGTSFPAPLSSVPCLSAFQYSPGTGQGDDYLTFCVGMAQPNNASTLKFGIRLLYFYD